jgi:hypothetical protein
MAAEIGTIIICRKSLAVGERGRNSRSLGQGSRRDNRYRGCGDVGTGVSSCAIAGSWKKITRAVEIGVTLNYRPILRHQIARHWHRMTLYYHNSDHIQTALPCTTIILNRTSQLVSPSPCQQAWYRSFPGSDQVCKT